MYLTPEPLFLPGGLTIQRLPGSWRILASSGSLHVVITTIQLHNSEAAQLMAHPSLQWQPTHAVIATIQLHNSEAARLMAHPSLQWQPIHSHDKYVWKKKKRGKGCDFGESRTKPRRHDGAGNSRPWHDGEGNSRPRHDVQVQVLNYPVAQCSSFQNSDGTIMKNRNNIKPVSRPLFRPEATYLMIWFF